MHACLVLRSRPLTLRNRKRKPPHQSGPSFAEAGEWRDRPRDGGHGLRPARLLRGGCQTRCAGRRAANEDRVRVSPWSTVEASRPNDSAGEDPRAPTLEEGVQIASTRACGKRRLPLQIDSRRPTSRAQRSGAGDGVCSCLQHPQPDDRTRETRLPTDRQVTVPGAEGVVVLLCLRAPTPLHGRSAHARVFSLNHCGACPIPASSGIGHRSPSSLSRRHRRANAALHPRASRPMS